jgi:phage terminase large subunit GpA-like protein
MSTHADRLREAFKPRPVENLTVDSWAERYRILSPSMAAVPGPFDTSRVEVARGPMRSFTEPGVKTVTLKTCTQLLKTTCIENLLGFLIHQRPGPILCAFPKEDMVRSFSKERLASMARATPALREILGEVMRDKSLESLGYKSFPGGFVALESAGSPTNLASRPIRVTLADEIDKFSDLKYEGDPILLLEERTATFPNALHVRACSPTVEETSRIEKSYNESDQRKPFVACPHCGHEQHLRFFTHVQWQKDENGNHLPLTAAIFCESCGAEWTEEQRRKLITTKGGVKWYQTRCFECCGESQDPAETRKWRWDSDNIVGRAVCSHCGKDAVSNAHAGFTASKLYSPHLTVASLTEQWITSKDDLSQKQVFYNTALGEAYSAQAGRRIEVHYLAERREDFGKALPRPIMRLTCGVDVQDDRLEAHVLGFGHPEEIWSVYYKMIQGSPGDRETWEKLDEFLQLRFPHSIAPGVSLPISATCIDSGGHHTQSVYAFCQPKAARNIWAIKGTSSRKGDPVWLIPKSRVSRDWGYRPQMIGVDVAKDHLRQMLMTEGHGPGFLHLPLERSEGWLHQLTAESPIYERKAGVTIRRWHLPRGRSNEAWDTAVYAYAAMEGLKAVRGIKMEKVAAEFELQALKAQVLRSDGDE